MEQLRGAQRKTKIADLPLDFTAVLRKSVVSFVSLAVKP
jgi:hypothetical protein